MEEEIAKQEKKRNLQESLNEFLMNNEFLLQIRKRAIQTYR